MYSRSFFLRGGYGSSHHPNHWARLFFGWLVVSMVQFKWVNFSRLASGLQRSAWGQMKTDGCVLNPVWMYKSGSIRYWTREEKRSKNQDPENIFQLWKLEKIQQSLNTLFNLLFVDFLQSYLKTCIFKISHGKSGLSFLIEPHQIHLWKRFCPKNCLKIKVRRDFVLKTIDKMIF